MAAPQEGSALQRHLDLVTERAALAEERVRSFRLDGLADALQLSPFGVGRIGVRFGRMVDSYAALQESLAQNTITSLPPWVPALAPAQIITAVDALHALQEPDSGPPMEVEDYGFSVQELLLEWDPRLEEMLVGARQAVRSGNRDRSRHFSSSMRDLLDYLLVKAAPNKLVLACPVAKQYAKDGHVSRPARLHYVCSRMYPGALGDYAAQSADFYNELFDVLRKTVHKLGNSHGDSDLEKFQVHGENLIRILLLAMRDREQN